MMNSITPQTSMAALLNACPEAIPLLLKRKMACVGCDMSPFETLGDAAKIYRVDLGELLEDILKVTAGKNENQGDRK